jgi:hypothetical protein
MHGISYRYILYEAFQASGISKGFAQDIQTAPSAPDISRVGTRWLFGEAPNLIARVVIKGSVPIKEAFL